MNIVDELSYQHEIKQLEGENLKLKAEVKALRALLVYSKRKKYNV